LPIPARAGPHPEQLDVKDQRSPRGNHTTCAALAVSERRGNHQAALATNLHPGHTLVPAPDHVSGAEPELEGLARIARAVELLAFGLRRIGIVEPAGVMHG